MAGLITTPGAYNANSFVTVEEVAPLAAELGIDSSEWSGDALTNAQKEARLMFAADLMGEIFSLRGYRAYQYQRLCFPRANCQELFGISLDTIPYEVKKAQVYIALEVVPRYYEARTSGEYNLEESSDAISSITMRGVSVTFKPRENTSTDVINSYIYNKHTLLFSLLNRFCAQIKIIDGTAKTLLRSVAGVSTNTTTT